MIYPPSQKPPIWSIDPGVIAYNCQRTGMPHPVGAWPFWEGGGALARDYSGRGNHGTLNGADWVAGGLDFNGSSDFISIGAIPKASTGANPRTIAFSFYADAFPTDHTSPIFTYAAGSGTGTEFFLYAEDNAVSVGFDGHRLITPKATLSIGTKYNVAVVVPDGSNTTDDTLIYIDGINQSLSTEAGSVQTLNTSGINVHIASNETPDAYMDGCIFYSLVYNVELSAAQVKFLHYNPYFMYQIPEELYGYVAGAPPTGNPFWYYNMLKRRN